MSIINIRAALESAIKTVDTTISTSFENVAFTPPDLKKPYQVINILYAQPDNLEIGRTHIERGYIQIKLLYPLQSGTKDINTQAELIRDTFYRGASFVKNNTTVTIDKTPEITPGYVDGNMYSMPIKIRFTAQTT